MTTTVPPEPTTETERTLLADALRRAITGEVEFSAGDRAMYSADASIYRHIPIGVVAPRTIDEVVAVVDACRRFEVPILARGAGTSIGGQATNAAVVIDMSRHLNKIIEIDPERRIARVQPGVVLDDLRKAAAPFGLTFGPDPSTHSRCTLGGMIGNDSCGARSIAWGKTSDNVLEIDFLLYDGTRLKLGPESLTSPDDSPHLRSVAELVADNAELIRTTFPSLSRRVSGYALDLLLTENGANLARAMVGTEGTCGLVLEATVELVEAPAHRALVVAGFADMATAADSVPIILKHDPLAVEAIDIAIIDGLPPVARQSALALPEGRAWLYIEFGGDTDLEARAVASRAFEHLATDTPVLEHRLAVDPAEQRTLWRIREDGSGLTSRAPDGSEAWPGWEDAAVPPDRLGDYLRAFYQLMERYQRRGMSYGHFGDGCVHVRIDFDLSSDEGVSQYRSFMEDAADLVVSFGGSLSGEHGDGQCRSELLTRMYPPETIRLFERFKAIWDPTNRMNPGRIVHPYRLDDHLRVRFSNGVEVPEGGFAYPSEDGFVGEVRRCIGIGRCIQDDPGPAVMCPSYLVTHEERYSTRGRARLLMEMLRGEVIADGWRSAEVEESLDLCLGCKGCKSDCPVQVDMASYKAEFLHNRYRHRIRPLSHYSMGYLPTWARLASRLPAFLKGALRRNPAAAIAKRLGGIDTKRSLPGFARESFVRWFDHRSGTTSGAAPAPSHADTGQHEMGDTVALWPDTFTNYFEPDIGKAAIKVLEAADQSVVLPRGAVCCGLTWISTGQLDKARRVALDSLNTVEPLLDGVTPIVVLEPSCAASLRDELPHLLPDDPRAQRLSSQIRTFAEIAEQRCAGLLAEMHATAEPGTEPVVRALVQTHCHQHAVLGTTPDDRVMSLAGIGADRLESGCCGLAGNFGFEKGHYDVSMAVGERVLLPRIRSASEQTLIVADGFSCRLQIEQGSGRTASHLAQVLADALSPRNEQLH